VFSNSVLEHVDDINGVLTEVARLLRSGGTFVFTVPSRDFQSCLRGPVLPGRDRWAYLERMDRRLYHLRYWGEQDWAQLLEPLGLRVEMARPYMSRAYVRRWERISGFTAGVLYLLWHRQAPPIEIQRRLGMRRSPRTMPVAIARYLARLLSGGLRPSSGTPYGCLLVRAQKTRNQ
jgi:SAM-dependent methyltransferase